MIFQQAHRYIDAMSSPFHFFFPKTLILGPGTGPTHSLRPAQHALHACEPSTTPMLKYNFLVSWIVDVGLQELEFLKGKGKSKRNGTIGIWIPNLTHNPLPTPTNQPTMLHLIKCTYYIYTYIYIYIYIYIYMYIC